jgi:hypothetical protein
MDHHFSADDLDRRRAAASRLGWILAAVVLLIYLAGLFVSR